MYAYHISKAIGIMALIIYLLVSTHAVIGQFSGPYSPIRPTNI